jgi:ribokinase
VDHFPKEGETLLATKFKNLQGGKGANQAFMISNLTQTFPVCFVSCVGEDENGKNLKDQMKMFKNSEQNIHVIPNINTTISQIFIDKNNNKKSVISTGKKRNC